MWWNCNFNWVFVEARLPNPQATIEKHYTRLARGEGKRTKTETRSDAILPPIPQPHKSAMSAAIVSPYITLKCPKQAIYQWLSGLLTSAHMTHTSERENNANTFTELQWQSPKKMWPHNEGPLHCASPIQGLLPENQSWMLAQCEVASQSSSLHHDPKRKQIPGLPSLAHTYEKATTTIECKQQASQNMPMQDDKTSPRVPPSSKLLAKTKSWHLDKGAGANHCPFVHYGAATEERKTDRPAQDPLATVGGQQSKETDPPISHQNKTAPAAAIPTDKTMVQSANTLILQLNQTIAVTNNPLSTQHHNGMDKTPQFKQRYDLCIHLQQKKQALSEWEAVNEFLAQFQAVDPMIMMYPWQSKDTMGFPQIPIMAAQCTFFDLLEIYVPCLASHSWIANPIRHP